MHKCAVNDMKKPTKRAIIGRLGQTVRGAPKIHESSKAGLPFVVSWRRKGKHKRWYFATRPDAEEKLQTLQQSMPNEGAEGVHFGAIARAEWYGANRILEPLGASVIEAARFYANARSPRATT